MAAAYAAAAMAGGGIQGRFRLPKNWIQQAEEQALGTSGTIAFPFAVVVVAPIVVEVDIFFPILSRLPGLS